MRIWADHEDEEADSERDMRRWQTQPPEFHMPQSRELVKRGRQAYRDKAAQQAHEDAQKSLTAITLIIALVLAVALYGAIYATVAIGHMMGKG